MQYFLAIDKGPTYYKNRFKVLALDSIDEERGVKRLNQDNNLKSICTFTMSFNNPKELKAFLIAKNILDSKLKNYDLVILYEFKGSNRTLKVPYKIYEPYFQISKLGDIIKNNVLTKENYLTKFLNLFKDSYGCAHEYHLLEEMLYNYLGDAYLYDRIRQFLNKLCYSKTKDGYKLSYRRLYETGMLVARLDNVKIPAVSNQSKETEILNETQRIEKEFLEDRDNDQLSFF